MCVSVCTGELVCVCVGDCDCGVFVWYNVCGACVSAGGWGNPELYDPTDTCRPTYERQSGD